MSTPGRDTGDGDERRERRRRQTERKFSFPPATIEARMSTSRRDEGRQEEAEEEGEKRKHSSYVKGDAYGTMLKKG
ncbi:hypothetical protein MGYG_02410 [Nannizzia gypsea CBS 118893]|uniref:Uncharacterized protein n=1 Tax=Arthroderma gypseum (strain ATCC MYA-4604 / CBS 118893) TaxID=535722 RepID=E4URH6_ARTGP|nr:hypothetical protein MGYG_02410 [Nannizzia gypsea CBS 118893]EFQ99398.1 hypothetical protein MGYG_02410 [Nannizzia gypsea CBS 118893]